MSVVLPAMPGLLSPTEFGRYFGYYDDAISLKNGRFALFTTAGNRSFVADNPADIRDKAMAWAAAGKPVYGHIHLHRLKLGEYSLRGRIQTASIAIGLFSDIDARGPGRKKSPETLCPTVADAIWVAKEFDRTIARLGLITDSGNGCYAFTGFKEPFVIQSDEDRRRLDAISRRYHEAFHRIAARFGWTGAVDYCDPAKVIRVPGTVNHKDPANPKPVRIVAENPARYNISDLEELLPQIEVPKFFAVQGNVARGAGSKGSRPAPGSTGMVALRVEPPTKELIEVLLENDTTFNMTWNFKRRDLRDDSCSGYDLALANIGVAIDLSDSQIAGLLVENRRRFPRPKQARNGDNFRKYIARTIAKVRSRQPGPVTLDFDDSSSQIGRSGSWGGTRG